MLPTGPTLASDIINAICFRMANRLFRQSLLLSYRPTTAFAWVSSGVMAWFDFSSPTFPVLRTRCGVHSVHVRVDSMLKS